MVDVVDLLDPVVLLQRHGVETAQLADVREPGLSACRASRRWCRGACARRGRGRRARCGPSRTTDRSSRPSFQAAAARSWERAAYSSTSRREKPSMVAMRSAPMPCGTKLVAMLVIGSANEAPPSEAMGTRDIDSTPPASTRSSQPERTFIAARLTASRPEAQKRFSWTPATVSGSPAAIAAIRAMSEPWLRPGPRHRARCRRSRPGPGPASGA